MSDFYDARLAEGADDGPTELPEEEGEAEEVEINFDPDDFGIKITAVLGNSSIVVEHAWDAAEDAATLAQGLPTILVAVQNALDAQEAQQ